MYSDSLKGGTKEQILIKEMARAPGKPTPPPPPPPPKFHRL